MLYKNNKDNYSETISNNSNKEKSNIKNWLESHSLFSVREK